MTNPATHQCHAPNGAVHWFHHLSTQPVHSSKTNSLSFVAEPEVLHIGAERLTFRTLLHFAGCFQFHSSTSAVGCLARIFRPSVLSELSLDSCCNPVFCHAGKMNVSINNNEIQSCRCQARQKWGNTIGNTLGLLLTFHLCTAAIVPARNFLQPLL